MCASAATVADNYEASAFCFTHILHHLGLRHPLQRCLPGNGANNALTQTHTKHSQPTRSRTERQTVPRQKCTPISAATCIAHDTRHDARSACVVVSTWARTQLLWKLSDCVVHECGCVVFVVVRAAAAAAAQASALRATRKENVNVDDQHCYAKCSNGQLGVRSPRAPLA